MDPFQARSNYGTDNLTTDHLGESVIRAGATARQRLSLSQWRVTGSAANHNPIYERSLTSVLMEGLQPSHLQLEIQIQWLGFW